MAARGYELTIFYKRAERVKYCFYHEKIKFISSRHHVIFFLLHGQECFCTNNSATAGNDIIDIPTSEDMENTPLKSRI